LVAEPSFDGGVFSTTKRLPSGWMSKFTLPIRSVTGMGSWGAHYALWISAIT
jgi:hypothetical protein